MLSHGWHIHSAAISRDMLGYRTGDVPFTPLPLFHGWARGIVMGAVTNGLEAVIDPEFSATNAMARIREVGATVFTGVGMMGAAMLAQPESPDDRTHNLRCAFMIPFSPEQEQAFRERFGVPVLSQMYGQTECGAITYSPIDGPRQPGTVGKPSPGFDVQIVDDDDRPVEPGLTGEIVVRPKQPDSMYTGYWRKHEETVAAWRNLWHHTGDFGRAGADGNLTFVDRKSDALRRRGENVSSVELETAIVAHPKIAEAAVHAVASELTEDDIKACLVAAEPVTPEELFAFFRDALPYFAIPRYVEIMETLPRTPTMRVQKHVLRERGITPETWDLEALGLVVERTARR
jgi:crotonobetaine/carnitine-CoA ligase